MPDLVEPRRAAAALVVAIAVLAVLGVIVAWEPRPALARFDLDEERTVPAYFSALLLCVCAVLALRLPRPVVSRGVGLALSGLLLLASLDEVAELHERLERRVGIDWQLLYIPVFLALLVVFGLLVNGLRRSEFGLWLVLAAAGCWAVAQALEALQWEDDGPARGYTWMMVTEEVLEMAGSGLLLLALLVVIRAARAPGGM
jgi:hypothetical protein